MVCAQGKKEKGRIKQVAPTLHAITSLSVLAEKPHAISGSNPIYMLEPHILKKEQDFKKPEPWNSAVTSNTFSVIYSKLAAFSCLSLDKLNW